MPIYCVLVCHKLKEPLSDAIPELNKEFPNEVFTITGSEEKGYKLRIEGAGDEKPPRKFVESFLKTWVPLPKESE